MRKKQGSRPTLFTTFWVAAWILRSGLLISALRKGQYEKASEKTLLGVILAKKPERTGSIIMLGLVGG